MTEPDHLPLWTAFRQETAPFSTTTGTTGTGCVVLTISGEIDLLSRAQFGAALQTQPEPTARAVVVDLSRVPFCDAHGVGELLRLRERAQHRAVPVHVVTTPKVHRCLEVLEATRTMATHPDLATALAAAGCQPA